MIYKVQYLINIIGESIWMVSQYKYSKNVVPGTVISEGYNRSVFVDTEKLDLKVGDSIPVKVLTYGQALVGKDYVK